MYLLSSEKKAKASEAKDNLFLRHQTIQICEPCNCGGQIRHNNGGNYHEIITLQRDDGRYFVKMDSTSEFWVPEWKEISKEEAGKIIDENSDWL